MRPLREPGYREALRRKVERARKRRQRLQRRKQEARAAKEEEKARAAEREAKIDQWRAKCIQEVEEKNRVRLRAGSSSSPSCTMALRGLLRVPLGSGKVVELGETCWSWAHSRVVSAGTWI